MNNIAPLIIISILLVVLLLLVVTLVSRSSEKTKQQKKRVQPKPVQPVRHKARSMEELIKVLQKSTSSSNDLRNALEEMIRHYGKIPPKLGSRPHPDFDLYMLAIVLICRHRNATKDIVLNFDRDLTLKNEAYKREINEAISKGLNARA